MFLGILMEEWERLNEAEELYKEKIEEYPVGNIAIKKRKGHEYLYVVKSHKGVKKYHSLGNRERYDVKEIEMKYRSKRQLMKSLQNIRKQKREFKSIIKLNKLKEIVG